MTKFEISDIQGVIPPMATPLCDDESLDEAGLRRLSNYLLEGGAHGLFVLGGTGEFFALPDGHRRQAIKVVVDEVGGRAPVIAGVTELSTPRAIENVKVAESAGANFIAAMPPYFYGLNQEAIYSFYVRIAEAGGPPVLLYNLDSPLPSNIESATVARLARHDRIVGIKDSEEFRHIQDVILSTDSESFRVMTGREALLYVSVSIGSAGGMLSLANVCPGLCADIYEAAAAGRRDESLSLQGRLNDLGTDLAAACPSSWWGMVKTCLNLLGVCGARTVHPTPPVSDGEKSKLSEVLRKHQLLSPA
jgi:4-hydroxy-tetrahydrodipicolinate synthase